MQECDQKRNDEGEGNGVAREGEGRMGGRKGERGQEKTERRQAARTDRERGTETKENTRKKRLFFSLKFFESSVNGAVCVRTATVSVLFRDSAFMFPSSCCTPTPDTQVAAGCHLGPCLYVFGSSVCRRRGLGGVGGQNDDGNRCAIASRGPPLMDTKQ